MVGDLAHAGQRRLDARKHGVEMAGQQVEFVATPAHGHALAEVTRGDTAGDRIDRLDAPKPAPAEQRAQHQGQEGGRDQHAGGEQEGQLAQVFQLALCLGHQQTAAVAKRKPDRR